MRTDETSPHGDAERGADAAPRPRSTRQRAAILAALAEQEDFRSARQIHEQMRAAGQRVGLATVYRNLQTMADGGQVDVLAGDDGEAIYRQCAQEAHHHHLVCRVCGRTVEVQAPRVEAWTREVAARHGYAEVEHTLEIFGVCAEHRSPGRDS